MEYNSHGNSFKLLPISQVIFGVDMEKKKIPQIIITYCKAN